MGTLHRLMFKAAYAEERPPLAPRPALARAPVERPAASDPAVGGGTLYRLLRSRAAMMEEAGAPDPPEASTSDASPSGEASTSDAVSPDATKKKRPAEAPKTYKKVEMPTPEQIALDDFMNNCAVKTVLATVMGGFLGATMGIFFGAFEPTMPGDEKLSVAQTLRNAARTSLQKAGSYAKGFRNLRRALQRVRVRHRADAREARHLQLGVRGVFHGGGDGAEQRGAGHGDGMRHHGGALRLHGQVHGSALTTRATRGTRSGERDENASVEWMRGA